MFFHGAGMYVLGRPEAAGIETLPPRRHWRSPLVTFPAVTLLFTALIYTSTSGAGACDNATDTHAHTLRDMRTPQAVDEAHRHADTKAAVIYCWG